jgi:hypothetical protein
VGSIRTYLGRHSEYVSIIMRHCDMTFGNDFNRSVCIPSNVFLTRRLTCHFRHLMLRPIVCFIQNTYLMCCPGAPPRIQSVLYSKPPRWATVGGHRPPFAICSSLQCIRACPLLSRHQIGFHGYLTNLLFPD